MPTTADQATLHHPTLRQRVRSDMRCIGHDAHGPLIEITPSVEAKGRIAAVMQGCGCYLIAEVTTHDAVTMVFGQQRHAGPFTPCERCDGVGVISTFRHVQHGRCFRCHGTGFTAVPL